MTTLDPDLLLRAYSIGVFPMSDGREAQDLYWVEPRHRAIIPLDNFHLSHSLRKTVRSGRFEVTRDTAFGEQLRSDREDLVARIAIKGRAAASRPARAPVAVRRRHRHDGTHPQPRVVPLPV